MNDISNLNDIRDIKGLVNIGPNLLYLVIFLAIVLIAAGIVLFFFYKKKKRKACVQEIIPKLPPDVVAIEMLRKLKEEKLIEQGKVKEFCIKVSDIIRIFFEGAYQVYAMDRTTDEILHELKNKKISFSQIKMVQNFLDNCDLIKFAKYNPFKEELYHLLEQAEKIVEGSKVS